MNTTPPFIVPPAEHCPSCNADLTGSPIPPQLQVEYYGGKTHYSRKIRVQHQTNDKLDCWQCPDCGHQW